MLALKVTLHTQAWDTGLGKTLTGTSFLNYLRYWWGLKYTQLGSKIDTLAGLGASMLRLMEELIQTYCSTMCKPTGTADRPRRHYNDQLCLTAYVTINGVCAYTLFKSGSTTNSISPDFMHIAKLDILELSCPVTLQLGCVGSCSKINYGTKVNTHFGPLSYDGIFSKWPQARAP